MNFFNTCVRQNCFCICPSELLLELKTYFFNLNLDCSNSLEPIHQQVSVNFETLKNAESLDLPNGINMTKDSYNSTTETIVFKVKR